jgi:hypothetical protein
MGTVTALQVSVCAVMVGHSTERNAKAFAVPKGNMLIGHAHWTSGDGQCAQTNG